MAKAEGRQKRYPIQAAGGIVLRHTPEGDEVILVHRTRYNDWTIPKGKAEPGESMQETALREVREETGCVCLLGEYAGAVGYDVEDGPKIVQYWMMSLVEQSPLEPNEEILAAQWFKIPNALKRLSYAQERALLSGAMKMP